MSADRPEPLVPAEVDLRDFAFMPLDVTRLFNSRFHAVATDSEWRAGVTLWCKSWQQVPCGSLPDDDIELCRLAELGRDLKVWRKLRENALHGWIKCSDGRLYHPVVTEKAADAWTKKRKASEKGRLGNEKRWGKHHPGDESATRETGGQQSQADPSGTRQPIAQGFAEGLAQASHRDRKGQGEGEGIEKNPHTPGKRGSGSVHGFPPGFEAFWAAYPRKTAKPDAVKAFARLKPGEPVLQAMLAALARQAASEQWTKDGGQFIPHPATWLNKRRWEDEDAGSAMPDIFAGAK